MCINEKGSVALLVHLSALSDTLPLWIDIHHVPAKRKWPSYSFLSVLCASETRSCLKTIIGVFV